MIQMSLLHVPSDQINNFKVVPNNDIRINNHEYDTVEGQNIFNLAKMNEIYLATLNQKFLSITVIHVNIKFSCLLTC